MAADDKSTLSRVFAAFRNSADDPLSAQVTELTTKNGELTAKVAELEANAESFAGIISAAATADTEHKATITDLQNQLATAQQATKDAEARAVTAEEKATKAEADAKTKIDENEKSVESRANKMAMDQMAKIGVPPPDKKKEGDDKSEDSKFEAKTSAEDSFRALSRMAVTLSDSN